MIHTASDIGQRTLRRTATATAVAVLALVGAPHRVLAQGAMPPDAVYLPPAGQSAPVSQAASTCPPVQWYLARSHTGQVWGYFFYTDGSGVSKADGSVDKTGRFKITLTNLHGNGPVGVATGRRGPNGTLRADLKGQGCANVTIDTAPSQPLMGPSAG